MKRFYHLRDALSKFDQERSKWPRSCLVDKNLRKPCACFHCPSNDSMCGVRLCVESISKSKLSDGIDSEPLACGRHVDKLPIAAIFEQLMKESIEMACHIWLKDMQRAVGRDWADDLAPLVMCISIDDGQ